jgi:ATP diphosphatase
VREELAEVEAELAVAGNRPPGGAAPEALADEIGDLLFAVVNLARKAGIQPGPALDRANRKFRERFEAVEGIAQDRGVDLHSAGLDLLDGIWGEVKEREK